jgi:hypothetical protein
MKLSAEMAEFLQQTQERATKEFNAEVRTLISIPEEGDEFINEALEEGSVEDAEDLIEQLEEVNARLDQLLGPLPDESLN